MSSAPATGVAFGLGAPQYLWYDRELVDQVAAVVSNRNGALVRDLAHNFTVGLEYNWVYSILELIWDDAEPLFELRQLYGEYGQVRLKNDQGYTPIARLAPADRNWTDEEHHFIWLLFEFQFDNAEDYLAVWRQYQRYKQQRRAGNPAYVPAGLTPQVDRRW